MDEIEIRAKANELLEDEVDRIRAQAVADLKEVVGPGRISPETAAVFLGVSYSTVYRWLGAPFSKLYMPQFKEVVIIAAFIGRVNTIRDGWKDVLAGWRTEQAADLKTVFYRPELVAVIDGSLPFAEKLERLAKKTVMLLADAEKGER
jgi:hypothetical protein